MVVAVVFVVGSKTTTKRKKQCSYLLPSPKPSPLEEELLEEKAASSPFPVKFTFQFKCPVKC